MKNFAKTALLSVALAASAMSAEAANTLTFDSGDAYFGQTYSSKGVFNDVYSFFLPGNSDVSGSVTSSSIFKASTTSKGINLTDFFITGSSGKVDGQQQSSGAFSAWSINAGNLQSGNYVLHVSGKVIGTQGGSYAGQLSVSPVPEPATWGMLLGGLGLVGFLARRREEVVANNYKLHAGLAAA